jgi:hypothetical protein
MKKILVLLSMCFMLFSIPSVPKLCATEEIPVYAGDLTQVDFQIIERGSGYLIVEIGGKKYTVKVQS